MQALSAFKALTGKTLKYNKLREPQMIKAQAAACALNNIRKYRK